MDSALLNAETSAVVDPPRDTVLLAVLAAAFFNVVAVASPTDVDDLNDLAVECNTRRLAEFTKLEAEAR